MASSKPEDVIPSATLLSRARRIVIGTAAPMSQWSQLSFDDDGRGLRERRTAAAAAAQKRMRMRMRMYILGGFGGLHEVAATNEKRRLCISAGRRCSLREARPHEPLYASSASFV